LTFSRLDDDAAHRMSLDLGNRVLPCFLVSNMRRALDFYVDVLGFTQTGYYPIESEPIRTEVRRDGIAIILYTEGWRGSDSEPAFSGGLYIFPKNVMQLADELRGKVPFAWGPHETDFGTREFAVRDPDGYTLMFTEPA
jgi:catechol 2,3-dioxygenase-like lactoylglutathione lyase family enzyme